MQIFSAKPWSPKSDSCSGYVRYSRQYVHKRAKKLVQHGLLEHLGNGVYVITERGERYIDGEIDTSEDAPDEIEPDGPTGDKNHEQA